jgi:hypothetical protein
MTTPNPMVTPLSTQLGERVMEIRSRIHTLLTHSNLVYRDFSGNGVVFLGPSSYWAALPDEAKGLQHDLRRDAGQWFDIVHQLVRNKNEAAVKQTREIRGFCESVINQDTALWERTTHDAARRLWKELDEQMVVVRGLYSETNRPTFVPDANALIANPALDEWDFATGTEFTIVLTPTILSELDDLKMGRPDATRTQKAARVVRQIKDYRRRGKLLDGVVLSKGRSIISAIAVEPDMSRSLAWLDASVNDDRFIASVVEVARRRPHAPVVAVSGDINVQNKFDMAGLPCIDPPEPEPS